MAQNRMEDMRLAGAKLEDHRHICAFFNSQDEEYNLLLPFIKEGIERGEKAFHIVDPKLQQAHRQRLEGGGINTSDLEQSKQLEIQVWENSYLRNNGCFDQHDMLALLEEVLCTSKQEGFQHARLVGHMEWLLHDQLGGKDIVEYESRLNHIITKYGEPVICVYDLAQFSAGTIIDILRVHPMVIMGGILHENPFYVPPDEFINELHARSS
jgi:hypothetical protein